MAMMFIQNVREAVPVSALANLYMYVHLGMYIAIVFLEEWDSLE